MPNYSLVVDATYDPLSYAEISAPIKEAAAYHQALQDSYDKMQLATAMYAPYVKDDPVAKEMYDRYMSQLNSATDALLNRGAWGQRERLSQARKSYGEDMVPIETAFKKREAEAAAQAQGRARGLEFSRDAATSKLSYYFDNPNGGYQIADPKQITGILAASASAFTNQLRSMSDEERSIFATKSGLPEWLIATVVKDGLSAQDIMNWHNHPYMVSMMQNALGSVGMTIDDKGNPTANDIWDIPTTTRILNAAISGFSAGAGKDNVQFMQDAAWAEEQQWKRMLAQQAMKEGSEENPIGLGNPNDHSWTVDDSLTNGYGISQLENAGALIGLKYNKDKNEFTIGQGDMLGDYIPGLLAEMTPLKDSASTIQQDIATKNGWYRLGNSGTYYKDKAHKQRVTTQDWANEFTKRAREYTGSYHTLQDMSLSSYNDVFKGQKIWEVDKINKNGTFHKKGKDTDYTTIGTILSDKDIQNAQVGVSSTATNNGIMMKVTKGGNVYHYFIDTDNVSDPNLRAHIKALNDASAERTQKMREFGMTSEQWAEEARPESNNKVVQYYQGKYELATKQLQHSIGGVNTVSSTSV